MKVVIADSEEIAAIAASQIAGLLRERPEAVIGLATGSSPLGVYGELIRMHRDEGLSFDRARGFMLDEYVGLAPGHPEGYRAVIQAEIAGPVGWPVPQVCGPDGLALDLDEACAAYEEAIAAAGGVDIQILGIGSNGHIAFNEPGSPFDSRTRPMPLAEQTRRDNARFFGGDIESVPTLCLTQGLGTIMQARSIVLLAQGAAKAEAVRELVECEPSETWPATVLQGHPDLTVLLDEGAASLLRGE
jgi:glucosamine-6-phosphate deaminase